MRLSGQVKLFAIKWVPARTDPKRDVIHVISGSHFHRIRRARLVQGEVSPSERCETEEGKHDGQGGHRDERCDG